MPFVDWVNKNQAKEATRSVPIHLLRQEAVYGGSDDAPPENLLIQGDNLLALKALLPVYAGRVKCIFIDPPYNTQSAFEHYDDKLEHSQWLSMMYPRLVLLRELLSEDGSLWVTIDDNEAHYLKVLMDEVFGRAQFVVSNVWQKRYSRENRGAIGDSHDYVVVYARNPELFKSTRNLLPQNDKQRTLFKNPNNDPRGSWQSVSLLAQGFRPNQMYEIISPSGRKHLPPAGNCWKVVRAEYEKLIVENRIYFGKDGNGVPRRMEFLSLSKGVVPWTWWPHEEVGHTDEAKKECNELFGADVSFGTPKPERLIQRIIHIATNPDDLVLDSFLGSGTTAAVAHKMGRRYIGIEMGDHARTHCIPRLEKVIAGEQGGISEAVGWKGGGGFRFCTLGQAAFDADGRINPDVRFGTLAAFVWHYETATPGAKTLNKPLLGRHNGTAYYLLFNGILGDKRPQGGNVLTHAVLQSLNERYPHDGPKVIYGETTRLGDAKLIAEGVTFKQIPYDVKTR